MRPLDQIVQGAILSHRMLSSGDAVVLAVSGGPDSVCLLHLMSSLAPQWRWRLHVAHLHHGIRGLDADQDARLVENLARSLGHPFYLRCCDIPRLAERRGLGLEEAGRSARYQFFTDLAREIGTQAIATGHHADDQVETILMNLLRGSGGTGLSGIQPIRWIDGQHKVIRPLLRVTRSEIEDYLVAKGISARHDHTNDELDQTRNRIRHQLLPYLQGYNPRIRETLTRTADILSSDEHYLKQQVEGYLDTHLTYRHGLYSLAAEELINQPLALQRRAIRRMVELISWDAKQSMGRSSGAELAASIGFEQIDRILEMIQSSTSQGCSHGSWSYQLPGGDTVRLSQGQLFFLSRAATCPERRYWDWQGTGTLELEGTDSCLVFTMVNHPPSGWDRVAHLDHTLVGNGVRVRYWQPGDRISLGKGLGTKKLSDLFIDAKIPAPYRSRIPVIEREGEIVAVAGVLVAPAFRPTADAGHAIEMQVRNGRDERKDCRYGKSNIEP